MENLLSQPSEEEYTVCLEHGYSLGGMIWSGGKLSRTFRATLTSDNLKENLRMQRTLGLKMSTKVAVKIIYVDLGHEELASLAQSLPQEIAASYQLLGFPHAVNILDVFVESKRIFIVTESIVHNTLDKEIPSTRDGLMDESTARYFFRETVKGVEEMHECGIAHCDISPVNICVTEEGIVKLSGFRSTTKCNWRLAKALKAKVPPVAKVSPDIANPSYAAPEVLKMSDLSKDPSAAAAADLWSLGVLLFELVNGKLPFAGETTEELLASYQDFFQGKCKLPFNERVSSDCKNLIFALLQQDPNIRMAPHAILRHRWIEQKIKLPSNFNKKRVQKMAFPKVKDKNFEHEHYVRNYLGERAKLLQGVFEDAKKKGKAFSDIEGMRVNIPQQKVSGVVTVQEELWRVGCNVTVAPCDFTRYKSSKTAQAIEVIYDLSPYKKWNNEDNASDEHAWSTIDMELGKTGKIMKDEQKEQGSSTSVKPAPKVKSKQRPRIGISEAGKKKIVDYLSGNTMGFDQKTKSKLGASALPSIPPTVAVSEPDMSETNAGALHQNVATARSGVAHKIKESTEKVGYSATSSLYSEPAFNLIRKNASKQFDAEAYKTKPTRKFNSETESPEESSYCFSSDSDMTKSEVDRCDHSEAIYNVSRTVVKKPDQPIDLTRLTAPDMNPIATPPPVCSFVHPLDAVEKQMPNPSNEYEQFESASGVELADSTANEACVSAWVSRSDDIEQYCVQPVDIELARELKAKASTELELHAQKNMSGDYLGLGCICASDAKIENYLEKIYTLDLLDLWELAGLALPSKNCEMSYSDNFENEVIDNIVEQNIKRIKAEATTSPNIVHEKQGEAIAGAQQTVTGGKKVPSLSTNLRNNCAAANMLHSTVKGNDPDKNVPKKHIGGAQEQSTVHAKPKESYSHEVSKPYSNEDVKPKLKETEVKVSTTKTSDSRIVVNPKAEGIKGEKQPTLGIEQKAQYNKSDDTNQSLAEKCHEDNQCSKDNVTIESDESTILGASTSSLTDDNSTVPIEFENSLKTMDKENVWCNGQDPNSNGSFKTIENADLGTTKDTPNIADDSLSAEDCSIESCVENIMNEVLSSDFESMNKDNYTCKGEKTSPPNFHDEFNLTNVTARCQAFWKPPEEQTDTPSSSVSSDEDGKFSLNEKDGFEEILCQSPDTTSPGNELQFIVLDNTSATSFTEGKVIPSEDDKPLYSHKNNGSSIEENYKKDLIEENSFSEEVIYLDEDSQSGISGERVKMDLGESTGDCNKLIVDSANLNERCSIKSAHVEEATVEECFSTKLEEHSSEPKSVSDETLRPNFDTASANIEQHTSVLGNISSTSFVDEKLSRSADAVMQHSYENDRSSIENNHKKNLTEKHSPSEEMVNLIEDYESDVNEHVVQSPLGGRSGDSDKLLVGSASLDEASSTKRTRDEETIVKKCFSTNCEKHSSDSTKVVLQDCSDKILSQRCDTPSPDVQQHLILLGNTSTNSFTDGTQSPPEDGKSLSDENDGGSIEENYKKKLTEDMVSLTEEYEGDVTTGSDELHLEGRSGDLDKFFAASANLDETSSIKSGSGCETTVEECFSTKLEESSCEAERGVDEVLRQSYYTASANTEQHASVLDNISSNSVNEKLIPSEDDKMQHSCQHDGPSIEGNLTKNLTEDCPSEEKVLTEKCQSDINQDRTELPLDESSGVSKKLFFVSDNSDETSCTKSENNDETAVEECVSTNFEKNYSDSNEMMLLDGSDETPSQSSDMTSSGIEQDSIVLDNTLSNNFSDSTQNPPEDDKLLHSYENDESCVEEISKKNLTGVSDGIPSRNSDTASPSIEQNASVLDNVSSTPFADQKLILSEDDMMQPSDQYDESSIEENHTENLTEKISPSEVMMLAEEHQSDVNEFSVELHLGGRSGYSENLIAASANLDETSSIKSGSGCETTVGECFSSKFEDYSPELESVSDESLRQSFDTASVDIEQHTSVLDKTSSTRFPNEKLIPSENDKLLHSFESDGSKSSIEDNRTKIQTVEHSTSERQAYLTEDYQRGINENRIKLDFDEKSEDWEKSIVASENMCETSCTKSSSDEETILEECFSSNSEEHTFEPKMVLQDAFNETLSQGSGTTSSGNEQHSLDPDNILSIGVSDGTRSPPEHGIMLHSHENSESSTEEICKKNLTGGSLGDSDEISVASANMDGTSSTKRASGCEATVEERLSTELEEYSLENRKNEWIPATEFCGDSFVTNRLELIPEERSNPSSSASNESVEKLSPSHSGIKRAQLAASRKTRASHGNKRTQTTKKRNEDCAGSENVSTESESESIQIKRHALMLVESLKNSSRCSDESENSELSNIFDNPLKEAISDCTYVCSSPDLITKETVEKPEVKKWSEEEHSSVEDSVELLEQYKSGVCGDRVELVFSQSTDQSDDILVTSASKLDFSSTESSDTEEMFTAISRERALASERVNVPSTIYEEIWKSTLKTDKSSESSHDEFDEEIVVREVEEELESDCLVVNDDQVVVEKQNIEKEEKKVEVLVDTNVANVATALPLSNDNSATAETYCMNNCSEDAGDFICQDKKSDPGLKEADLEPVARFLRENLDDDSDPETVLATYLAANLDAANYIVETKNTKAVSGNCSKIVEEEIKQSCRKPTHLSRLHPDCFRRGIAYKPIEEVRVNRKVYSVTNQEVNVVEPLITPVNRKRSRQDNEMKCSSRKKMKESPFVKAATSEHLSDGNITDKRDNFGRKSAVCLESCKAKSLNPFKNMTDVPASNVEIEPESKRDSAFDSVVKTMCDRKRDAPLAEIDLVEKNEVLPYVLSRNNALKSISNLSTEEQAGVIKEDIVPRNIMQDDKVKLTDGRTNLQISTTRLVTPIKDCLQVKKTYPELKHCSRDDFEKEKFTRNSSIRDFRTTSSQTNNVLLGSEVRTKVNIENVKGVSIYKIELEVQDVHIVITSEIALTKKNSVQESVHLPKEAETQVYPTELYDGGIDGIRAYDAVVKSTCDDETCIVSTKDKAVGEDCLVTTNSLFKAPQIIVTSASEAEIREVLVTERDSDERAGACLEKNKPIEVKSESSFEDCCFTCMKDIGKYLEANPICPESYRSTPELSSVQNKPPEHTQATTSTIKENVKSCSNFASPRRKSDVGVVKVEKIETNGRHPTVKEPEKLLCRQIYLKEDEEEGSSVDRIIIDPTLRFGPKPSKPTAQSDYLNWMDNLEKKSKRLKEKLTALPPLENKTRKKVKRKRKQVVERVERPVLAEEPKSYPERVCEWVVASDKYFSVAGGEYRSSSSQNEDSSDLEGKLLDDLLINEADNMPKELHQNNLLEESLRNSSSVDPLIYKTDRRNDTNNVIHEASEQTKKEAESVENKYLSHGEGNNGEKAKKLKKIPSDEKTKYECTAQSATVAKLDNKEQTFSNSCGKNLFQTTEVTERDGCVQIDFMCQSEKSVFTDKEVGTNESIQTERKDTCETTVQVSEVKKESKILQTDDVIMIDKAVQADIVEKEDQTTQTIERVMQHKGTQINAKMGIDEESQITETLIQGEATERKVLAGQFRDIEETANDKKIELEERILSKKNRKLSTAEENSEKAFKKEKHDKKDSKPITENSIAVDKASLISKESKVEIDIRENQKKVERVSQGIKECDKNETGNERKAFVTDDNVVVGKNTGSSVNSEAELIAKKLEKNEIAAQVDVTSLEKACENVEKVEADSPLLNEAPKMRKLEKVKLKKRQGSDLEKVKVSQTFSLSLAPSIPQGDTLSCKDGKDKIFEDLVNDVCYSTQVSSAPASLCPSIRNDLREYDLTENIAVLDHDSGAPSTSKQFYFYGSMKTKLGESSSSPGFILPIAEIKSGSKMKITRSKHMLNKYGSDGQKRTGKQTPEENEVKHPEAENAHTGEESSSNISVQTVVESIEEDSISFDESISETSSDSQSKSETSYGTDRSYSDEFDVSLSLSSEGVAPAITTDKRSLEDINQMFEEEYQKLLEQEKGKPEVSYFETGNYVLSEHSSEPDLAASSEDLRSILKPSRSEIQREDMKSVRFEDTIACVKLIPMREQETSRSYSGSAYKFCQDADDFFSGLEEENMNESHEKKETEQHMTEDEFDNLIESEYATVCNEQEKVVGSSTSRGSNEVIESNLDEDVSQQVEQSATDSEKEAQKALINVTHDPTPHIPQQLPSIRLEPIRGRAPPLDFTGSAVSDCSSTDLRVTGKNQEALSILPPIVNTALNKELDDEKQIDEQAEEEIPEEIDPSADEENEANNAMFNLSAEDDEQSYIAIDPSGTAQSLLSRKKPANSLNTGHGDDGRNDVGSLSDFPSAEKHPGSTNKLPLYPADNTDVVPREALDEESDHCKKFNFLSQLLDDVDEKNEIHNCNEVHRTQPMDFSYYDEEIEHTDQVEFYSDVEEEEDDYDPNAPRKSFRDYLHIDYPGVEFDFTELDEKFKEAAELRKQNPNLWGDDYYDQFNSCSVIPKAEREQKADEHKLTEEEKQSPPEEKEYKVEEEAVNMSEELQNSAPSLRDVNGIIKSSTSNTKSKDTDRSVRFAITLAEYKIIPPRNDFAWFHNPYGLKGKEYDEALDNNVVGEYFDDEIEDEMEEEFNDLDYPWLSEQDKNELKQTSENEGRVLFWTPPVETSDQNYKTQEFIFWADEDQLSEKQLNETTGKSEYPQTATKADNQNWPGGASAPNPSKLTQNPQISETSSSSETPQTVVEPIENDALNVRRSASIADVSLESRAASTVIHPDDQTLASSRKTCSDDKSEKNENTETSLESPQRQSTVLQFGENNMSSFSSSCEVSFEDTTASCRPSSRQDLVFWTDWNDINQPDEIIYKEEGKMPEMSQEQSISGILIIPSHVTTTYSPETSTPLKALQIMEPSISSNEQGMSEELHMTDSSELTKPQTTDASNPPKALQTMAATPAGSDTLNESSSRDLSDTRSDCLAPSAGSQLVVRTPASPRKSCSTEDFERIATEKSVKLKMPSCAYWLPLYDTKKVDTLESLEKGEVTKKRPVKINLNHPTKSKRKAKISLREVKRQMKKQLKLGISRLLQSPQTMAATPTGNDELSVSVSGSVFDTRSDCLAPSTGSKMVSRASTSPRKSFSTEDGRTSEIVVRNQKLLQIDDELEYSRSFSSSSCEFKIENETAPCTYRARQDWCPPIVMKRKNATKPMKRVEKQEIVNGSIPEMFQKEDMTNPSATTNQTKKPKVSATSSRSGAPQMMANQVDASMEQDALNILGSMNNMDLRVDQPTSSAHSQINANSATKPGVPFSRTSFVDAAMIDQQLADRRDADWCPPIDMKRKDAIKPMKRVEKQEILNGSIPEMFQKEYMTNPSAMTNQTKKPKVSATSSRSKASQMMANQVDASMASSIPGSMSNMDLSFDQPRSPAYSQMNASAPAKPSVPISRTGFVDIVMIDHPLTYRRDAETVAVPAKQEEAVGVHTPENHEVSCQCQQDAKESKMEQMELVTKELPWVKASNETVALVKNKVKRNLSTLLKFAAHKVYETSKRVLKELEEKKSSI